MTTHAHLQRQLALALRLQQAKRALSFPELQTYLLEQTPLRDVASSYSRRTFERDLKVIAEDFGVAIRYDARQRGYVVDVTDPGNLLPGHQRLLEAMELQAFLRLPATIAPYVQLEARQPLGLEHLRPLLSAVQSRQLVEFTYRKFWEGQPTRRLVGPLLLKEFRGRWYVLSLIPESGELRCFGLDQAVRHQPGRASDQSDAHPRHRSVRGARVDACLRFSLPSARRRQRVELCLQGAAQPDAARQEPVPHALRSKNDRGP